MAGDNVANTVEKKSSDFDKVVKKEKKTRKNNKRIAVVVTLILLVIGTYFCVTKLFVFEKLVIKSDDEFMPYTAEEIIKGAHLEKGRPIHNISLETAQANAKYTLPYVDVKFEKRFPGTIVAKTSYRKPAYYITVAGNMYVLSEDLVVLEKTSDIEMIESNALIYVKFSQLSTCVEGEKIALDEEIEEIFSCLIAELKNAAMLGRISEIDMQNKFDIMLQHDTRYSVKIGDRSNLDKKIVLMKTVIDDKISVGESGSVDVTDENIKIMIFKKN